MAHKDHTNMYVSTLPFFFQISLKKERSISILPLPFSHFLSALCLPELGEVKQLI